MNQILAIILMLLLSNIAISQDYKVDERRHITVTGSAEATIFPDEIELEIILQEYSLSKTEKVDLLTIESKFIDVLKENYISENQMVFGNSDYSWYSWWSYRNDTHKQKSFKVKLDSTTDFLSLVQDLDIKGVKSLRISNSSNDKIIELRKEIKISAIRAAKEKARYLLESIDEVIGKVISIEEVPEKPYYYRNMNIPNFSNAAVSTKSSNKDIENVASIKLRYEVKATFEIE